MRNLGEFPTLVDQGEEQTYPDEDEIRLSDGDASDTGGVLPEEDVARTDPARGDAGRGRHHVGQPRHARGTGHDEPRPERRRPARSARTR